jgi:ribosomal protein S18 acetylase RimI-like enzyme
MNQLDTIQEAYIGMISEASPELDAFVDKTKSDHPELKTLNISPYGKDISLGMINIHKEHRNSGVGSKVMDKIKDFADTHKKRIILSAATKNDDIGTTSSARLDKFYRGHGFVANKGRNKDFSITATHYRDPK